MTGASRPTTWQERLHVEADTRSGKMFDMGHATDAVYCKYCGER